MPKKKSNEIRVATLAIHRAGDMTEEGREELANWLRDQADFLKTEGSEYSKRFTARYDVTPRKHGVRWFK